MMNTKNKVLPLLIEIFAILFLLTTFATAAEANGIKTHREMRRDAGLEINSIADVEADFEKRALAFLRKSDVEKIAGDPTHPLNGQVTKPGQFGAILDKWHAKFVDAHSDGFIEQKVVTKWLAATGGVLALHRLILQIQDEGIKGAKASTPNFSKLFGDEKALCSVSEQAMRGKLIARASAVQDALQELAFIPLTDEDVAARKEFGVHVEGPALRKITEMLLSYGALLNKVQENCDFFHAYAKSLGAVGHTMDGLGVTGPMTGIGQIADPVTHCEMLRDKGLIKATATETIEERMAICIEGARQELTGEQTPFRGSGRRIHLNADDPRYKQRVPERPAQSTGQPLGNGAPIRPAG